MIIHIINKPITASEDASRVLLILSLPNLFSWLEMVCGFKYNKVQAKFHRMGKVL